MLDCATATEEGDENRDSVGDAEANCCAAGEGVESCCGAEVL